MSTIPQYFAFNGDAETGVSAWMRSNEFLSEVSLSFSGSASILAGGVSNAWKYDNSYQGAALSYTLPSSSIYMLTANSSTVNGSGSFSLYLTPAETASVAVSIGGFGGPSKVILNPVSNRAFAIEQNYAMGTAYVTVVNALTFAVENTFTHNSTTMIDGIYNSVNGTVWVWLSGSSGEFFYEYNASGSALLASHSVSTDWWPLPEPSDWLGQSWWGYLAYNPVDNHILMCPENSGFSSSMASFSAPLTNSIYDCDTDTVIHQYVRDNIQGVWPQYVSSSHTYYVFGNYDSTQATIKIDAGTFAQTVLADMTGSSQGGNYVAELDRIFFTNPSSTACSVFDPSTDTLTASIMGIKEMNYAVYDPCVDCVVLSDDTAGGNFGVGGLCYLDAYTYEPLNFVFVSGGPTYITFCPETSTVLCANWQTATVQSIFSSRPTGSFPYVPPIVPPPTASFTGTPLLGMVDLVVTFTNTSTDYSSSYWNFGDSTSSVDTNPVHVYYSPGVYTVSLLVSSSVGSDTETKVDYVSASFFVAPEFCVDPPFQAYGIGGNTILPQIISN